MLLFINACVRKDSRTNRRDVRNAVLHVKMQSAAPESITLLYAQAVAVKQKFRSFPRKTNPFIAANALQK